MDHQIVPGMGRNGHRASRSFRGGINRPHVGAQQTGAALCFMDGSDTKLAESSNYIGFGALNTTYDCGFHSDSCRTKEYESRESRLSRAVAEAYWLKAIFIT